MFFNLKKLKRFCVFMLLSLTVCLAFGEDHNSFDPYEDEEEIACEDISEAFTKYEQDSQIHNYSLQSTLSGIEKHLKKFSKEKKVIQADLLQMISDIENIKSMIADNQFSLSMQSDNILFSIEECLNNQE